jgi:hypothetical protein
MGFVEASARPRVGMRWYRAREGPSTRVMHIVVLAWLYVTFAMALTMRPVVVGVAFFLAVGFVPVAILAVLAARRRRASMGVARVDHGDDRDAEADQ